MSAKHSQGLVSENASYKIVALLITLILWVIILGSKEATVVKMVSTDYLFPKDMVIVNSVPHEVAFRISGPRLTLKRFSESEEPLAIDLTSALEGLTTIRIHPDSIDVPPGLHVVSVSPATITPRLERLITQAVPVAANLTGDPPRGRRVVSVTVTPALWEVAGVRSLVENVKFLKTEPIDLTGHGSSLTRDVGLIIDDPGLVPKKEARVRVDVVIK
jgi:YbbR domain-containing protein